MDGIFVIDKGEGMTSHDVVARVRRMVRQKRVGHAGTLDPAATGVLPILLGQATRVAEYLSESGKAYRAVIRFGVETNTYDREGEVTRTAPTDDVTLERITAALPDFLGEQDQLPPIYSAIKRDGRPLYALARAGEEVTVEPRRVRIDALRVVAWQPPDLTLDVECGKGTYIRSLAHDLGQRLGPGAHLAALRRTRSGPFTLDQAITLEALEQALATDTWRTHVFAADEALLDWRALILGEASEARMRNGQPLRFGHGPRSSASGEEGARETSARVYSTDGRFLGIALWSEEQAAWQPHKVLPATLEVE
ncbi:MAG TPA: tRNA pseudouridine(55) synthase TruB [Ktedonobacterales bacterium]|nr:tRNA pseudouridine(55) synthase TruB [Ktedonobacterales bacterium]